jgi:hypothetical protein
VWRSSGYDFGDLVDKVFGKSMKRPLKKFHGAQIEALFKKQARYTLQCTAMQCTALQFVATSPSFPSVAALARP